MIKVNTSFELPKKIIYFTIFLAYDASTNTCSSSGGDNDSDTNDSDPNDGDDGDDGDTNDSNDSDDNDDDNNPIQTCPKNMCTTFKAINLFYLIFF